MREFCWVAAEPVPAVADLRRLGWRLSTDDPGNECTVPRALLLVPHGLPLADWLGLTGGPSRLRAATAVLGIGDAQQRSRLLRMGFGEALGWGIALAELEQRVERMLERAESLPRRRQVGALVLDLAARDGFVAGRPLGLHPREFALIWRLAENPGYPVSSAALLCDVWRLSHRPETNSLAVHVSRLRAKLRLAGLDHLVATTDKGGYCLAVAPRCDFALDAADALRKEQRHMAC